MKNKIVNNTFELYKHIGASGDFLNNSGQYFTVAPKNASWPNKVFDLNESTINFKKLKKRIELGEVPNSISILENENIENKLLQYNFKLQSIIKAMYLDLKQDGKPIDNFASIERVDNTEKAKEFATIASTSFGFNFMSSTVISLIGSPKLKLFIGKYDNKYVSCGMILLDENGISGLHVIGTFPDYQGLGLGKIMTNKLLFEAHENRSKQVVLIASKSGERIYSKLGFMSQGQFKGYIL